MAILTAEAVQGYCTIIPANQCPYLATSDSWNAWFIGAWMRETGRSLPRDVRSSRGNTYHVNDMKVRVVDHADIERIA